VLSLDTTLMYPSGDPKSSVTWANKLELHRKLFSLQLKDGESVQKHIKATTEIFDDLSVIGVPVK